MYIFFVESKIVGEDCNIKNIIVQVGQTRTCFSFVADRWYPVANTSIDHLIKIQEYAETGNIWLSILAA